MKKNERTIQFFDLHASGICRAKDMPELINSVKSISELCSDLDAIRDRNLARQTFTKGSKFELRLEDMDECDDYWILLINIVDTSAAHPVTQEVGGSDDDRRVVELSETRGLESSAHIVIYKYANEVGKHLVLFERNGALSFARAVGFLNNLLRLAAKHYEQTYTVPHPSGIRDKTVVIRSHFSFIAHPSDELMQEIEGGKLSDITLISDLNVVKGYDLEKQPELMHTEIKMSVDKGDVKRSGGNWNHIQKALQYGDSLKTPTVRVRFTDVTGTGHTANLSTDTNQLLQEDRYVKKRRISDFKISLRTSFPVIQESIVEKMLELTEAS